MYPSVTFSLSLYHVILLLFAITIVRAVPVLVPRTEPGPGAPADIPQDLTNCAVWNDVPDRFNLSKDETYCMCITSVPDSAIPQRSIWHPNTESSTDACSVLGSYMGQISDDGQTIEQ